MQSDIPVTMEDLEKEITMIDAKLRELQQSMTERKEFEHSTPRQPTTTTRQSTLFDSGMETGRPSMFPRQSTSPVRSAYTPSRGSVQSNVDNEMFDPRLLGNEERGTRPKDTGVSSARYLGDEEDDFMSGVTTRRPSRVRFSPPKESYERPRSDMQPKPTGVHMKPATYDGTIAWQDYHSHFEACADLNGWTERAMGTYLAVSLRGNALGVLGNLPRGRTPEYRELVKVLEERFAPPSQTELYRVQMRERRQKPGETLPELGQAIRRLANLAYPTASSDIKETLAKDQFVDALVDSEMRIRIKQSRPTNLNEAIKLAVELEAYNRAERKCHLRTTMAEPGDNASDTSLSGMLSKLMEKFDTLQRDVNAMKSQKTSSPPMQNKGAFASDHNRKRQIKCYNCHKKGHVRKDCLLWKKGNDHGMNKPDDKRQNSKSQAKQGPTHGSVGANNIGLEAGMFLRANVQGVDVLLLVDTGATLTLVSNEVAGRISKELMTNLDPMCKSVYDAGGKQLNVSGRGSFGLSIDSFSCTVQAAVADLTVDGILGLDFLTEYNCSVDLSKQEIIIGEYNKFQMVRKGHFGCFRVVTLSTVTIPANREVVVPGKVRS